MAINRVVLVGNLTRDPELKYTPSGVAVANMGIAVNRITKNDRGDYDVDFFNIVAFQRTADYASRYLVKGNKVAVDGRLQTRSWVAQDGTKRSVVEIVADSIQGLDRREGGMDMPGGPEGDMDVEAAPAPRASAPASTPSARSRPAPSPVDDDLDEADPFADE